MTDNRRRGAKRCLFGRQDHEKVTEELEKQIEDEQKTASRDFSNKWNFELGTDTPLPGRYEWEKVTTSRSEPSASTSLLSLPNSAYSDTDAEKQTSIDQNKEQKLSTASDKPETVSSIGASSSSSQEEEEEEEETSNTSYEEDVNQNILTSKRKASNALNKGTFPFCNQ